MVCQGVFKKSSLTFRGCQHIDHFISSYLDGIVEFVACEAGNVEKDAAEGVGDPRFGLPQASDKGFVAFAGRPSDG